MSDIVQQARMRAVMIRDGDYSDPIDGYLTSDLLRKLADELTEARAQIAAGLAACDQFDAPLTKETGDG
jgi:hypothetical protein